MTATVRYALRRLIIESLADLLLDPVSQFLKQRQIGAPRNTRAAEKYGLSVIDLADLFGISGLASMNFINTGNQNAKRTRLAWRVRHLTSLD
ncbi:hypothetical protein D6B98_36325 [Bradyrhizobium sp. LVM 105]|nr:hypothetical protein D6B98_36325 [Bradyrhizobium sp. LVM 105]